MKSARRFKSAITERPRSSGSRATRRTEGVRTHGRSARVVSDVLRATAEEIGRVGYAGLRVEDVAERSGVNKTTIYRRWPNKVDLVAATIRHFAEVPEPPDTGSVREDLLVLLRGSVARSHSTLGRGLLRMLQLERTDPEVDLVAQQIAKEQLHPRHVVIERAVDRGDLPQGTDVELVVELVFAPVIKRIVFVRSAPDDFLESVVDIVLAGAKSGAAIRGQLSIPGPLESARRKRPRRVRG